MHLTMSALYKVLISSQLSTVSSECNITTVQLFGVSTLLGKQAGHKAEMRTISQFDGYQTYIQRLCGKLRNSDDLKCEYARYNLPIKAKVFVFTYGCEF